MNKRPIDKTKKANIKCEHCEFCPKTDTVTTKCLNEKSPKFAKEVHYWNRCKCFEWRK